MQSRNGWKRRKTRNATLPRNLGGPSPVRRGQEHGMANYRPFLMHQIFFGNRADAEFLFFDTDIFIGRYGKP